MLATLRGRFDETAELIEHVAAEGRRAALPDTDRLVGTLHGQIAFYRGAEAAAHAGDQLWPLARRLPGHYMEAAIAAWLVLTGRADDAQAELDRVLPAVLAGSGPRQLGSAAALAFVAAQTGDVSAAAQLREALLPYHGRPRRAAADAERARVNVTRTLRAAIDRITRAAPIAGTHLSCSIRTGTVCRYEPAPGGPARWQT